MFKTGFNIDNPVFALLQSGYNSQVVLILRWLQSNVQLLLQSGPNSQVVLILRWLQSNVQLYIIMIIGPASPGTGQRMARSSTPC